MQSAAGEFSMTADSSLPLWQQIRAALSAEIAAGQYPPGARLPTEAALARRFGVNRHTLRRALAALSAAGIIHVRRGSGAYVAQARIDYRLGTRTRFSQNLSQAGQSGARTILRLETLPAEARQAETLRLPPGSAVHVLESVGLADGVPLTLARSAFPAAALPDLAARLRASGSVTEALTACGVADYRRLWTRLTAEAADAVLARHLHIAPGSPLLHAVALNVDGAGRPVEFGRTWFCTDRVQLVVEPADFGAGSDPLS